MSENSELFEAIKTIIDAWKEGHDPDGSNAVDSLQHAEQLHLTFPDMSVVDIRQSIRHFGRDACLEVA